MLNYKIITDRLKMQAIIKIIETDKRIFFICQREYPHLLQYTSKLDTAESHNDYQMFDQNYKAINTWVCWKIYAIYDIISVMLGQHFQQSSNYERKC